MRKAAAFFTTSRRKPQPHRPRPKGGLPLLSRQFRHVCSTAILHESGVSPANSCLWSAVNAALRGAKTPVKKRKVPSGWSVCRAEKRNVAVWRMRLPPTVSPRGKKGSYLLATVIGTFQAKSPVRHDFCRRCRCFNNIWKTVCCRNRQVHEDSVDLFKNPAKCSRHFSLQAIETWEQHDDLNSSHLLHFAQK